MQTSQVLHEYSTFPGVHQVMKIHKEVRRLRRGKVVKRSRITRYAITDLSPRQASARTFFSLVRRHWHIENKSHYVRDDGWREDRQTYRSGNAFTMFLLLSIATNLLRTPSRHWTDSASMVERAEHVDYLLTCAPQQMLRRRS